MSQKNKLIILVVGTVLLCIMLIIDCRIFFNGKIQHTIKVDGMEEGIKYTKQRFGENIEKYLLSEHDIGSVDYYEIVKTSKTKEIRNNFKKHCIKLKCRLDAE